MEKNCLRRSDLRLKEAQKLYKAEVLLLAQGIFEGKFSPVFSGTK